MLKISREDPNCMIEGPHELARSNKEHQYAGNAGPMSTTLYEPHHVWTITRILVVGGSCLFSCLMAQQSTELDLELASGLWRYLRNTVVVV